MTIGKTLTGIVLAGALALSGTGCSKDKVETTERAYKGFYNGFIVRIDDKKEVHYHGMGVTPKFSMTCRLDETHSPSDQNPNNPFKMIYGEDHDLDGEWDFVSHLPKDENGYYDLHPRDIAYAKRMLDEAVEAVGISENQVKISKK